MWLALFDFIYRKMKKKIITLWEWRIARAPAPEVTLFLTESLCQLKPYLGISSVHRGIADVRTTSFHCQPPTEECLKQQSFVVTDTSVLLKTFRTPELMIISYMSFNGLCFLTFMHSVLSLMPLTSGREGTSSLHSWPYLSQERNIGKIFQEEIVWRCIKAKDSIGFIWSRRL